MLWERSPLEFADISISDRNSDYQLFLTLASMDCMTSMVHPLKTRAFAASLPAVFVQVPSGLAAEADIQIATTVTNNTNSSNYTSIQASSLDFGFQTIQISIAIAAGLFASALLVYPFARNRSRFFSF